MLRRHIQSRWAHYLLDDESHKGGRVVIGAQIGHLVQSLEPEPISASLPRPTVHVIAHLQGKQHYAAQRLAPFQGIGRLLQHVQLLLQLGKHGREAVPDTREQKTIRFIQYGR